MIDDDDNDAHLRAERIKKAAGALQQFAQAYLDVDAQDTSSAERDKLREADALLQRALDCFA